MKEISLTQGKIALVDDTDYEAMASHKWHAIKAPYTYYAARDILINGQWKRRSMHREILGLVRGDRIEVDHRNGDGLDNRRENLRKCNDAENQRNRRVQGGSSQYKGVSWRGWHKKWGAQIAYNGKKIYIGSFKMEINAAHAYDAKARELFGEFARTNFPKDMI
jgi:hypothetical protein